jgi:regulatory protein
MLEVRARGADELKRLLLRKGEPAAEVEAALERLAKAGLIDDASYARQLARTKALGAGLSRRRIQQELSRRGVAREVSSQAISEVFDEEGVDEMAAMEGVARKKLRTLVKLDPPTRKRRLYAFLARRGYDSDDISAVLRRILDGDGEPA